MFCVFQGQQITVQGQQVAQTAEGQTIVYQPVNADGTVLQQGMYSLILTHTPSFWRPIRIKVYTELTLKRRAHV